MNHRNVKNPQFTEIFEQYLKNYPDFSEISEIARRNSRGRGKHGKIGGGKIWIIGGFVYRPIIRSIYPELKVSEPSQTDIDLLIERGPGKRKMYHPNGWNVKITESGYLYLEREKTRIDLNFLFSFPSIASKYLIPKFEYFFRCVPMDIQAIAYDLTDKNVGVIGDPAIEAIKNKKVRINDLDTAKFEAQKRGLSLEGLVKQKAEELNFDYDLIPIHPSINPAEKARTK